MENKKIPFKERAVAKLKSYYGGFLTIQAFLAVTFIIVMIGPRLFGYTTFTVVTDSMYPNLKRGYVTFVDTGVKAEEIEKDDIIAFNLTSEASAIHRVVEVNRETEAFSTKGDANNSRDAAPVYYSQLVGKSVAAIPVFGYIQLFFMSIGGKIICFGILIFDIVVYIMTIRKEVFNKEDDSSPAVPA